MLGRPFFVMERVAGEVYEMQPPADASDDTVARMCESLATVSSDASAGGCIS
ncbi:hypothetical protein MAHJHV57_50430 [Mycobacterium avium subsp. hominissuis]